MAQASAFTEGDCAEKGSAARGHGHGGGRLQDKMVGAQRAAAADARRIALARPLGADSGQPAFSGTGRHIGLERPSQAVEDGFSAGAAAAAGSCACAAATAARCNFGRGGRPPSRPRPPAPAPALAAEVETQKRRGRGRLEVEAAR